MSKRKNQKGSGCKICGGSGSWKTCPLNSNAKKKDPSKHQNTDQLENIKRVNGMVTIRKKNFSTNNYRII